MAELKVFWTITARKQRDHIFKYWNKRNRSTAYSKKLNRKIKDRLKVLKAHPEAGKATEFKTTRTTALGHYSIFYQVMENQIIIMGF